MPDAASGSPATRPVTTAASATYAVLEEPMTREEYRALDAAGLVGERGEVTFVVSLELRWLVEPAYEAAIDRVAHGVFAELGSQWQVHSYRLLAADPRHAGTPSDGSFGLFAVTVDPGFGDVS